MALLCDRVQAEESKFYSQSRVVMTVENLSICWHNDIVSLSFSYQLLSDVYLIMLQYHPGKLWTSNDMGAKTSFVNHVFQVLQQNRHPFHVPTVAVCNTLKFLASHEPDKQFQLFRLPRHPRCVNPSASILKQGAQ